MYVDVSYLAALPRFLMRSVAANDDVSSVICSSCAWVLWISLASIWFGSFVRIHYL